VKKWALPLAVLVLLFMLYKEFTKPGEKLESAPPPPHAQTKKAAPLSQPVNPQVTPVPAPAPSAKSRPSLGKTVTAEKSVDGQHPKPPKGTIPFEVHDDLVVAYGDILLGKPTREDFPERGYIEAPPLHAWPKNEIAYSFEANFPNPDRVNRVINYFNEFTPVKFVPYSGSQQDSIVFARTSVQLCLSYVGRISGHQPIYLDDRCGEREIMHELMHALGFIHEQSRPDRDSFVRINWAAIQEDKQSQFDIAPPLYGDMYKGRPFDYQSIMIYGPTDFAKRPGETTMESLTGAAIQPSAQGLSPEDLQRLIGLYAR
jgi:hypothetical protein